MRLFNGIELATLFGPKKGQFVRGKVAEKRVLAGAYFCFKSAPVKPGKVMLAFPSFC